MSKILLKVLVASFALLFTAEAAFAEALGVQRAPQAPSVEAPKPDQQAPSGTLKINTPAAKKPKKNSKSPGKTPEDAAPPATKDPYAFSQPSSSKLVEITKDDYKYYLANGHRSKKWDDLIKPAFDAFDAENIATSSIFLQKAYDEGCRDPLVLFRLALYRESRGMSREAAIAFEEAAAAFDAKPSEHPLAKTIHKHSARSFYKLGDYKTAIVRIQKALEYEPNDFMLLFMAAQIFRSEGALNEARTLFERAAMNIRPEDMKMAAVPLFRELVNVTCALDDLPACEDYAKRLESISPRDPAAAAARQKVSDAAFKKREKEIIEGLTRKKQ